MTAFNAFSMLNGNLRILDQLKVSRDLLSLKGGADGQTYFNTDAIPAGHAIGTPQVLFTKITDDQIAFWRKTYGGQSNDLK
jgi:hypothetical protein